MSFEPLICKNIRLVFLFFASCLGAVTAVGQERDLKVYPYWSYYSDVTNVLYETISETAFQQLDERKSLIENLKTEEDWVNRQKEVKETLMEILGPFPEKTPLNPVITGTIRQDGMIIEKLYFESRPGYYVTAIFTYPADAEESLPAILFCSGHADVGFRSATYQHIIFNYVKKGFAVLAFDPVGQGERIRYLDEDGKPRMGPTKEHSYPGSQSFLAGISPATFFIWDGIRAVDYLLTRKEVDPERLGITGRSGGGTQTAYIAALDDRLYASAPECYITTFDKLLKSLGPQDAEQNLINGIARGIDMADYLEVRAPKPTLIVSTTRDIFSIQGVRDVYAEAKSAFGAFGALHHLEKTEDDAGHASTIKNREATYAFFQKHLNQSGHSKDEEVPVFEPEELYVTPTGNVYRDLRGEDIYSLTVQDLRMRSRREQEMTAADLRETLIRESGYRKPDEGEVVFSGRTGYEGYDLEKYLIRGSGTYYLPLVWLRPVTGNKKTILYLDDEGKEKANHRWNLVDRWLEEGYSVVIADLAGTGEIGGGYSGGDARIDDVPLNVWFAGILTGRSITGILAEEINRIRNFLYDEKEENFVIVGQGGINTALLHALYFQPGMEEVLLVEPLVSYASLLDDREYQPKYLLASLPGGIQIYDLDDLAAHIGRERLLMINPVNARSEREKSVSTSQVKYTEDENDIFRLISEYLSN